MSLDAAVNYILTNGVVGDPPAPIGVTDAKRRSLSEKACAESGLPISDAPKVLAIGYAALQVKHSTKGGLAVSDVLSIACSLHGATKYIEKVRSYV